MLNSRQWMLGLGLVVVGSGFVLAETPVMRSILRRPVAQAPADAPATAQGESSDRKFKGFGAAGALARAKAQEQARGAAPETRPDQAVELPGLEVTFGSPGDNAANGPELSFVPTPVVDNGDPESSPTRPLFDAPPVSLLPETTGEEKLGDNPAPQNMSQQPQLRMNQPQPYRPQQQQQPSGFRDRRRMRRAGAMNEPQQPAMEAATKQQALVRDDAGPSILDIEMPADAIATSERPAATTAARPAGYEIPADGKRPLFQTR